MSRLHAVLALLLLLVVSCGDGPTPPKAPSALDIGMAKAVASPDPPRQTVADPLDHDELPIPVSADDPQIGPTDALVTMIIFTDLQCPYCAKLAKNLDGLREAYGDNLRIVLKHQPLAMHPYAKQAAAVAQMIWQTKGSASFWKFHDKVFTHQKELGTDALRQWAIDAGASDADVESAMREGSRFAEKVARDAKLGDGIDARATPTSFVNGIKLSGAQPTDKFRAVIDRELAAMKELDGKSVTRAKLVADRETENFKANKAPKDDDDDEPEDNKTAYKVPVGKSPVQGKNTALVTVVEFADFQCPFCKRAEQTLVDLKARYGDKVRIVWKDEPLPFHKRAEPAAELARFARAQKGDAGFWDMHDRLFASQPNLEDSDLAQLAKDAGLDAKKAMAAVDAHTYKSTIDADEALGDDVQAAGTPHFFVNGRRIVGAVPLSKFIPVVDEEIAKAEALVKAGTAATAVYDTLQKDALPAPEPDTKTVKTSGSAPFRGTDKAPVVITEYADFECPFCFRVEGTLEQLLKDYPGKIKIVWRNLPLPMHQHAELAAEAAREAFVQKGNDGFQKYRELLFKNQLHLERADLEGYASTVGLDITKFNDALDKHTHKKQVDADHDAANDAGVTGTPAFTIGPWFVSGAQPIGKFKKLIDRTLNGPPPKAPEKAPTSLVVKDLAVGTGAGAKNGDKLEVKYTGTLLDGKVFDTTQGKGQNFTFELGAGHVIKGWEQGLVGMKVGGKRKLVIPPDLAYGDGGAGGGKIPPKSALVFEVELIAIK